MKVVVPYRPFPRVGAHKEVGPFDWVDAIRMLRVSIAKIHGEAMPVEVLTDARTLVPEPVRRYETVAHRLQLWLIEIRLAYLRSEAFDQDTVLLSPDTLVMRRLDTVLEDADLAVIVRPGGRFEGWKQILNTAQWWSYAAKPALVAFYERVLAIGQALPEEYQLWGGDTEAMLDLLSPIEAGTVSRAGLRVTMLPSTSVFRSISSTDIRILRNGQRLSRPGVPLFDFKYRRKQHMRLYFEAQFPDQVVAR